MVGITILSAFISITLFEHLFHWELVAGFLCMIAGVIIIPLMAIFTMLHHLYTFLFRPNRNNAH